MEKIKADRLLLAGDSWMDGRTWYQEIFDSEQVTDLAVVGSGNKFIAESVMSHIMENKGVDHILVNWSGLNRIDIPLPRKLRMEHNRSAAGAEHRHTSSSRYWTNSTAPWRDKDAKLDIEERLLRMMYQEKGYASVKNQALISMINLQDFLKVREIPYLFCFMYDYANKDFDHNHLTGEANTEAFSTLGSVDGSHPVLAELDRRFCLEPSGLDWALRQPIQSKIMKDTIHLTNEGYHAWAREMMKQSKITK
jgi:hypothetical protein